MKVKAKVRNTYKYKVLRNGTIVMTGVTNDIKREAGWYKARWPDCTVEQVGLRTTRTGALKWARRHGGYG